MGDPALLQTLHDLRTRVRAATGADRELDAKIAAILKDVSPKSPVWLRNWRGEFYARGFRVYARAVSGHSAVNWAPEPYTSSLDAAVALVERLLPDSERTSGWDKGRPFCFLHVPKTYAGCQCATEPLAILDALLSAVIFRERKAVRVEHNGQETT